MQVMPFMVNVNIKLKAIDAIQCHRYSLWY